MGTFYTQHILERLKERGITKDILETVGKTGEHNKNEEGKITVKGIYEGGKVKIIARNKESHTILITSYFYD